MPVKVPHPGPHSPGFGESPQESLRNLLAHWSRFDLETIDSAARSIEVYVGKLVSVPWHDDRIPASSRRKLQRRFEDTQRSAVRALDGIVGAGLEYRRGSYVRPPALPTAESAQDWQAWCFISALLPVLGASHETRMLCVCESCTVVFAPRRKGSARFCRMCEHRPITAPPLGGQHGPIEKPGDCVTIRLPRLWPETQIVRSWSEVTLGLCAECGDPYHGRADRRFHSEACRQRHHRRHHHDEPSP
jgi:hypothetical protein